MIVGDGIAITAFIVVFSATTYLLLTAKHYWASSHLLPFKRDCLAQLANSPEMATGFERFCDNFDIATSTAQGCMRFFMLFSLLNAFGFVAHMLYARRILKHLKDEEIHNHVPENIGTNAPNSQH